MDLCCCYFKNSVDSVNFVEIWQSSRLLWILWAKAGSRMKGPVTSELAVVISRILLILFVKAGV